MHYSQADRKWQIGKKATLRSDLRERMTPEAYAEQKKALKEFLLLKKETRLLGGSRVMGKDSIWVTGLMPNTAREGERF